MKRRSLAAAAAAVFTTLLATACSGSSPAAQKAYDSCVKPDAEVALLALDGDTVRIEVTGDAARAVAGADVEVDKISAGVDAEDVSFDGLAISMSVLLTTDCMVEATGFPGTSDQLEDGDEWEGWRYSVTDGVGAEWRQEFTAD